MKEQQKKEQLNNSINEFINFISKRVNKKIRCSERHFLQYLIRTSKYNESGFLFTNFYYSRKMTISKSQIKRIIKNLNDLKIIKRELYIKHNKSAYKTKRIIEFETFFYDLLIDFEKELKQNTITQFLFNKEPLSQKQKLNDIIKKTAILQAISNAKRRKKINDNQYNEILKIDDLSLIKAQKEIQRIAHINIWC